MSQSFVDSVYEECRKHYNAGGDIIVECFSPEDILRDFKSLDDVRAFIGVKIEQELNTRWGEDSDPQVQRARDFDAWNGGANA